MKSKSEKHYCWIGHRAGQDDVVIATRATELTRAQWDAALANDGTVIRLVFKVNPPICYDITSFRLVDGKKQGTWTLYESERVDLIGERGTGPRPRG